MSASILNGIIEYTIITINICKENALPTTVNGSPLINSDEIDKHFAMLKDAWK
uniref:Uncharacterized protein n=1 Tax=Meloidogyne hapla TaxID=6305 RepID=A0A1I8BJ41_MELHA